MMNLDMSDVMGLLSDMKNSMSERQYTTLLYRVMNRTGSRAKTLVAKEVTTDYQIPYGKALSAISPPMTTKGNGVTCVLRVSGARGKIARDGGKGTFKATPVRSRNGKIRKMQKKTFRAIGAKGGYAVQARILKGGMTILPKTGEGTHFMVSSGPREGEVYVRLSGGQKYTAKVTYTKKNGVEVTHYVKKDAIRPGVGIGVPQMPMNRSAPKIQARIIEVMRERILHEHRVIMENLARKHKGAEK
jgi:hypothetical protein